MKPISLPSWLYSYLLRLALSLLALIVAAALLASSAHAQPTATNGARVRRFAIVASSNDGGAGRPRLRFANSDARAISEVLRQLGGLDGADLLLMPDVDREKLERGFAALRGRIDGGGAPGVRRELFVYYSGHSDEEGLLLGKERLAYSELRRWIDGMGAEVRIAVLDSCASGALLRQKGGRHRPSFLSDVSSDARGHAFLTASSENEAAQESDRIGAAYFTHYLVSGLRGAADSSHDGRVTLGEAYQFAYHETLQRTERTRGGAQHPAYDIQLAGTGDLVMTDLRTTDATLVLDRALKGRIYVRDSQGRLLVELRKEPVYPVELGLSPGRYRVALDSDGRPYEAEIEVRSGGRSQLAMNDMKAVAVVATTSRGDADVHEEHGLTEYRDVPVDLMLSPGLSVAGDDGRPVRHKFVFGLVTESDELCGMQFGLGANLVRDRMSGMQVWSFYNQTLGPSQGLQLASLANYSAGGFTGAQMAGIVSVAKNGFKGAQFSVGNYVDGPFSGAQFAVVNVSRDRGKGAQFGVVNVEADEMKGLQSGVINYAHLMNGIMLGVINVGGTVDGAQIGVINVADTAKGGQIGVINVARELEGESFGLLPFAGNGYHALQVFGSDVSAANLSFKLGGRHLYTVLGGGLKPGRDAYDGKTVYSTHIGLGAHFVPFGGKLFIDTDVLGTQFGTSDDFGDRASVLGSLRLVFGYQLLPHVAITGGPTFNVETSWDAQDYDNGRGFADHVIREDDTTVRLYPGLMLGLQI